MNRPGGARQALDDMHAIVRAVLEDAQAIIDLQRRTFAAEAKQSGTQDIPPLQESLAAIEDHIRNQTALTARVEGTIVGSVRGVVEGTVCMIRALAIDPSCQGRGIGSSLLAALERAHPQVTRFELTTNAEMEGSVPFYERQGYRVAALTRVSDRINLAHMFKTVAPRGAS